MQCKQWIKHLNLIKIGLNMEISWNKTIVKIWKQVIILEFIVTLLFSNILKRIL